MTPPTTHGSPGGINDGGADALWYARARLRILRTEFDAWSGRIAAPR